jgi:hypothetical protein
MTDLSGVIENIARLFDSLDVRYAIMGGIAVRAYGIPRATYDVDFTAAIEEANLPGLFEGVQALGYAVPDPNGTVARRVARSGSIDSPEEL